MLRIVKGSGRPHHRAAFVRASLDVPDFIPVAGQLDHVVIVALGLRSLLRGGGEPLVREHWPGPDTSLALVLRVAA